LPTAELAKTVAAINDLIKRAITEGNRSAQYAYIAPFRSQAKRVAWDYLKFYAAPVTKATNESDLIGGAAERRKDHAVWLGQCGCHAGLGI
jgi:hypothetical protein